MTRSQQRQWRKVPSIAVMPFANLRADKENERFSDGLWSPLAAGLHASPRRPVLARKMNLPEAASPG